MHPFQDNAGRTWIVSINGTTALRVRATTRINVYRLVDGTFEKLWALLDEPLDLIPVVYQLCKDQTDKQSITEDDFGRAIGGDSIDSMRTAFYKALVDFFPDPRRREAMTKVMKTVMEIAERDLEQMHESLSQLKPPPTASTGNGTPGSSPASSESTPAPSLSASST